MDQDTNNKKSWLPQSPEGKKAMIFSILAILWGILLPMIPFPEWLIEHRIITFFSASSRILLLFVLLAIGFYYLRKAIFILKDRARLLMILFVLFCLIAAFWILFMIGEFAFPH